MVDYLTFLHEEFLPAMRTMFPLSDKCEDNFVGGLSMSGYGAFKWAFTYPGNFSHVINFSGGVDIRPRLEHYIIDHSRAGIASIKNSLNETEPKWLREQTHGSVSDCHDTHDTCICLHARHHILILSPFTW